MAQCPLATLALHVSSSGSCASGCWAGFSACVQGSRGLGVLLDQQATVREKVTAVFLPGVCPESSGLWCHSATLERRWTARLCNRNRGPFTGIVCNVRGFHMDVWPSLGCAVVYRRSPILRPFCTEACPLLPPVHKFDAFSAFAAGLEACGRIPCEGAAVDVRSCEGAAVERRSSQAKLARHRTVHRPPHRLAQAG